MWGYLEVKSCISGRKKNPSKPLQTTSEVLKVYSIEDLVLKQVGSLFVYAVLPCPSAEISIDSI